MSYDLFFKRRQGALSPEHFVTYFSKRPHYMVEGTQAWYQNQSTGVYFVFELRDEEDDSLDFPYSFNLNYFRPSFFGLEAEPEVHEFVRTFDLVVSDPQTHGMGDGEYQSDLFLKGWNFGNEFGYEAILQDPANRADVVSLPTRKLLEAWRWNREVDALQQELGGTKFVPSVFFLNIQDKLSTVAVWPDGIPIAVPDVDWFVVPRKDLAPRRFLKRIKDQTFLSSIDAVAVFRRHGVHQANGTLVLSYVDPPKEIRSYVERLPIIQFDAKNVPADQVLDQELVEKYTSP